MPIAMSLDNYGYLIMDQREGTAILVDPADVDRVQVRTTLHHEATSNGPEQASRITAKIPRKFLSESASKHTRNADLFTNSHLRGNCSILDYTVSVKQASGFMTSA